MSRTRKELAGKKLHNLLVIKPVGKNRNGGILWKCLCDCGNEKVYSQDHLTRKKSPVKSCGCLVKAQKGSKHPQWKGCGDISGGWWQDHVVRSAKGSDTNKSTRKPLSLTLTIDQAWDLFLAQDRKCALSGVDIRISPTNTYNTASLDRIDSSLGYDLNNVQWVHKHVNLMKNKFEQSYFIDICKKITRTNYEKGLTNKNDWSFD